MTVGFIGLGTMGLPMARRLARAGTDLVVWNRSPGRAGGFADVATDLDDLFARADVVILMLRGEDTIRDVLTGRALDGRTVVHMGTTAPGFSQELAATVARAGGAYVEAPVSGSRKPAEDGELVAMLAGDPAAVELVRPLLAPMCRETFVCGPVPRALTMKLAVNVFLIATVTGLAESFHFADRHGLDLRLLRSILDAGQMSSSISRVKTAKLAARDFEIQAGLADVLENNRLVVEAARSAGAASPVIDACFDLYTESVALGHGADDMAGVIIALEARTSSGAPAHPARTIGTAGAVPPPG
jgi:3-hydroxyisobutyrate dehydrogenase